MDIVYMLQPSVIKECLHGMEKFEVAPTKDPTIRNHCDQQPRSIQESKVTDVYFRSFTLKDLMMEIDHGPMTPIDLGVKINQDLK